MASLVNYFRQLFTEPPDDIVVLCKSFEQLPISRTDNTPIINWIATHFCNNDSTNDLINLLNSHRVLRVFYEISGVTVLLNFRLMNRQTKRTSIKSYCFKFHDKRNNLDPDEYTLLLID